MLTAKQVEAARAMLVCIKTGSEDEAAEALAEDDDYREERAANARESLDAASVLGDALTAVSAYERVAALLDLWPSVYRNHHIPPEVREAVKGCADDLARALNGG